MLLRLRTLVAALAVAAITVAALPAGATAKSAATPKPKPTCKRSNSTTVAQNRLVRVFTRPDAGDGYFDSTDLLGCWKKTGRVRLLAYAYDDDYVSSADFGLVRLRGQFVAFYFETYDISCKAGCPPDWQARRGHLHVADIRYGTGFRTEVPARPAGNRLLLGAHGALAWPQWLPANQVEVRVVDGAGERAVDSGAIHPESLALTAGNRLTWVNDGTARSMLLRRSVT